MLAMGDFNRSGGRNFSRRDFGNRGQKQMHKTICSKCAKQCEVPFIPSGTRPVFCSECFQSNRTSNSTRPDNNYRQVNRLAQPQYQEQFEALSIKLDKILKILEPKATKVAISLETPKVPKVKKEEKKSASVKKK